MTSPSFFAKIKDNYGSKFSSLSISNGTSFVEKDGNSEDDTLIHKAFLKYFDGLNQEYPDWLEANVKQKQQARVQSQQLGQQRASYNKYQHAEFQPVQNDYQRQASQQNQPQQQQQHHQHQPQQQHQPHHQHQSQQQHQQHHQHQHNPNIQPPNASAEPDRPAYQQRSSSRLQDMYNKSRQQTPGASYSSLPHQPVRTNSAATSGSRLRDRMQQGQPVGQAEPEQAPSGRATWGRR